MLLEVRNLILSDASGRRPLLTDVSVSIEAGEKIALLGESGAGKTLLGNACAGALPNGTRVVGGKILFSSQRTSPREHDANTRVVVPQFPARWLPPFLPVGHLIRDALTWGTQDALPLTDRIALELFERVGLGPPETAFERLPDELSGGMCQRVGIALALARKPELCFLDEPTSGLDPHTSRSLRELLESKAGELGTLVVATHDIKFIVGLVNRYIFLRQGEIAFTGDIHQLRTTRVPYVRDILAGFV